MTTLITIQVISLKGFPVEFQRKYKNSTLSIVADIDSRLQECGKTLFHDENVMIRDGMMLWKIDPNVIQNLKATQPKIKIQIYMKSSHESTGQSVGFALIDVRDLGKEKKPQWLKIHGYKKAEMQLKTKIIEDISSDSSNITISNAMNINSPSIPSSSLLPSKMQFINNTLSKNSNSSSTSTIPKMKTSSVDESLIYQLHMSIMEYNNIHSLCISYCSSSFINNNNNDANQNNHHDSNEDIAKNINQYTFFMSWKLFGQTFYSEEFSLPLSSSSFDNRITVDPHNINSSHHNNSSSSSSHIIKPVQDIFQVQCHPQKILSKLKSEFPLLIQLCARHHHRNHSSKSTTATTAVVSTGTSHDDITTNRDQSLQVIATASISFPMIESTITTDNSSKSNNTTTNNNNNNDSTVMMFEPTWFDMTAVTDTTISITEPPALVSAASVRGGIKVGFELQPLLATTHATGTDTVVNKHNSSSSSSSSSSHGDNNDEQEGGGDEGSNKYEDDEYEDDEFDTYSPVKLINNSNGNSNSSNKNNTDTAIHNSKNTYNNSSATTTTTQQRLQQQQEQQQEDEKYAKPKLISTSTALLSKAIKASNNNSSSSSSGNGGSGNGDGSSNNTAIGDDDGDDDDGNVLHQYRLSIDVKSISQIKRPANIVVSYSYPFLGASAVVRTQPQWVLPHTEVRFENHTGSAVYDCCMSRHEFSTIIRTHPFKILVSTRTSSGSSVVGEVSVDLAAIQEQNVKPVLSYRCIVTSKTFNTLDEYKKHRNILIQLSRSGSSGAVGGGVRDSHSSNKYNIKIPPVKPITIHAVESYYTINTSSSSSSVDSASSTTAAMIATGGKLRILSIIEDLGLVGHTIAVPVRQGYSQQRGAVYTSVDGLDPDGDTLKAIQEYNRHNHHHRHDKENIHNNNHNHNNNDDDDGDDGNHINRAPTSTTTTNDSTSFNNTSSSSSSSIAQKNILLELQQEWEIWRKSMELKWREAMREKEVQIRHHLEQENKIKLKKQMDDMRIAYENATKFEIKLRDNIEAVQQQQQQLIQKEEQMNHKLAQKAAELQLLTKRVREESKIKIDNEIRRNESLELQITTLKVHIDQLDKRCKDTEYDFEVYRKRQRNTPESALREEAAKLRAQLAESRAEVERERRLQSDIKLEKEHVRTQLHRLALALKREKERNSTLARQDLEQLRLEYLAREEKYILDGDREELRNIRHELASLRIASFTAPSFPSLPSLPVTQAPMPVYVPVQQSAVQQPVMNNYNTTTATNMTHPPQWSEYQPTSSSSSQQSPSSSQRLASPPSQPTQRVPSTSSAVISTNANNNHNNNDNDDDDDDELIDAMLRDSLSSLPPVQLVVQVAVSEMSGGEGDQVYLQCIDELTTQLNDLLTSGLYTEDDLAIQALRKDRLAFQQQLDGVHRKQQQQ